MAPSVREIARLAGVSASTVSRALNRPADVSKDTRERVEQAAASLGWTPENAPRTQDSADTVAIIVPDLEMPPFASIVKSAQQRFAQAGFRVFFADSGRDHAVEARLINEYSSVAAGTIVCSPRSNPDELREYSRLGNLVLVDAVVENIASVTVDYAGGMAEVVDNLVALGHRRISYAGARSQTWSEVERRSALSTTLLGRGLEDFVDLGKFGAGIAAGYAAADQLVASEATAVICINSFLALGMMKRLERRGVHVPSDVSIVVFDNVNSSQLVAPLLSSIVPPVNALGWAAADALLQLIREPAGPRRARTIGVELRSMETTDFRVTQHSASAEVPLTPRT